METTTHPLDVKKGDYLTVLHRGIEIKVRVEENPVKDKNDGLGTYWSCNVYHPDFLHAYASWNEDTQVWELGEM